MFSKLLKHEFRATGKMLGPLSFGALLAGAVGYLIMLIVVGNIEIEDISILDLLSSALLGGIFLMLFAYVVGASIFLYYRFYKHKFSDEGYLTFTLPVSTHKILLSSMLNMVIWNIIIYVVLIISFILILIPIFSARLVNYGYDFQFSDLTLYEDITAAQVITQLLYLLGNFAYSTVLPMLAISIGSLLAKKHKLLASFGIGYGINLGVSFITGILTVFDKVLAESMVLSYGISLSTLLVGVFTLAMGVCGYFLMHQLVNDRLNI